MRSKTADGRPSFSRQLTHQDCSAETPTEWWILDLRRRWSGSRGNGRGFSASGRSGRERREGERKTGGGGGKPKLSRPAGGTGANRAGVPRRPTGRPAPRAPGGDQHPAESEKDRRFSTATKLESTRLLAANAE